MRNIKGASFVEAAIALPIILIALFGVIDVCRYGFALAMFQLGAHRGADMASKIEEIISNNETIQEEGIERIREETLRYARFAGLQMLVLDNGKTSPFVTITPNGNSSLIRIEVIAPFNSLIPFLTSRLFVRAQSLTSSLSRIEDLEPLRDCSLFPNAFGCNCVNNNNLLCDCPPNQFRDINGNCRCRNPCGNINNNCLCDCQNDTCTPPFEPDPSNNCICICPQTFQCPNRFFDRNQNTCICTCNNQRLNEHCISQQLASDFENCICRDQSFCPPNKHRTREDCQEELGSRCAWFSYNRCGCVECDSPQVCLESGFCGCPRLCSECRTQNVFTCECSACEGAGLVSDNNNGCVCGENFCGGTKLPRPFPVKDGCECRCQCPDGFNFINGECVQHIGG